MGVGRVDTWESRFRFDALLPLVESGNRTIALFTRCDLKGQPTRVQDL